MADPFNHWTRWAWAGGVLLAAGAVGGVYFDRPARAQIAVQNQGYVPYSDAPIFYRTRELHDPVAELERKLENGQARLVYDKDHGYLKSVLSLLKVPVNSQTLVFSKTSFQYPKISPEHPRALYYNDDVYVGQVHDGKAIEIVSFDAMQGAIFYLLDEQKADKPAFQRAELDCTQCHIARETRGVPGVFLRSVNPTTAGALAPRSAFGVTDQKTPWKDRWGGWYVNGSLAPATLGNTAFSAPPPAADADAPRAPLVASPLPPAFDKSQYLTPTSDQVALLVLAHQTQMHNLITLTNYQTRLALYDQVKSNSTTVGAAAPSLEALPEAARRQITAPAEQLLRYLLFAGETPLGGLDAKKALAESPYARAFAERGPRDSRNRSLRDFDLHDRIFRYPCSYLIYSSAFDAIPEPAKGYVYHRLLQVLTGQDQSPDFSGLSAQDRQAILQILIETKPGLPAEWLNYARSNHLRVAALPQRAALD
jgi:hypothetical protein